MPPDPHYAGLIDALVALDRGAKRRVAHIANCALTARNWLWGAHIVEFDQAGARRAPYGRKLLVQLAADLAARGAAVDARNLRYFRHFALAYPAPAMRNTLCSTLRSWVAADGATPPAPSAADPAGSGPPFPKLAAAAAAPLAWQTDEYFHALFASLTWSHLRELIQVDDPLERAFYEIETLQAGWSVRELKRQRQSLLAKRVGLATIPEAAARFARTGTLGDGPPMLIRDPYVLEFLGLASQPAATETELEQRLIDHIDRFLRELGPAFSLAGRQKRITIDGQHFYIDLLFYHARLRCHVVVELKTTEFRPEYIGQLNFYLNYVGRHISAPDDAAPIGILLCTDKSEPVVRYATAGLDQQLFVSRYLHALPSPDELARVVRASRDPIRAPRPAGDVPEGDAA